MQISELVKEAHDNAQEHGWWEGNSHNVPEKLCLVHSEISEALEELRSFDGTNGPLNTIWFDDVGKPMGFAIELADAVIRIADLCGHLGIDLERAISVKHEYNKTRPHRHGGKAF